MKKILILSLVAALVYAGCKKPENTVSIIHTYSTPIITISGSIYYSIKPGGTLPTISATAVDTFYHENCGVVVDQSTLDVNTPGLYNVVLSAKNKYGMKGTKSVFVAVTNISDSLNLSGWYNRLATPNRSTYVSKLARGMFMTSNVGGVDTVTQSSSIVSAVFAVTSPADIDFGSQLTSAGTLTTSQNGLAMVPGDTTVSYALALSGFGTQVRTFTMQ